MSDSESVSESGSGSGSGSGGEGSSSGGSSSSASPASPRESSSQSEAAKHSLATSVAGLRRAYEVFTTEGDPIREGDLVMWKPGMRNKRFPLDGAPAVCTKVLPVPIVESKKRNASSPYFRESLGIVVGLMDGDGDFTEFYLDKRRFRKITADGVRSVHIGVTCKGCGSADFSGSRHKCTTPKCNVSFCDECLFAGRTTIDHDSTHRLSAISAPSADQVRTAYTALTTSTLFKVGDIVEWKPLMKNKNRPKIDELCVVIEVLPYPVFELGKHGCSSCYFREPLDLRLGTLDSDGDLVTHFFDSRRFQKAALLRR